MVVSPWIAGAGQRLKRTSQVMANPMQRVDLARHEELIRGLLRPEAYPEPVDRVERIDTHISTVLLAGEHAYKVKKPLDLGFLDFTTLEKRRQGCVDEVRLNRRTAPDIYLDVVAVTGAIDAPRIGSDPATRRAVPNPSTTRCGCAASIRT